MAFGVLRDYGGKKLSWKLNQLQKKSASRALSNFELLASLHSRKVR